MTDVEPKIVVLGSINMDLVVRCRNLPMPGQTVLADSSSEFCGGKGANQAVAASLAGGSITMIGAVGDDSFANRLLENMKAHNIDRQHIFPRSDLSSGMAVIGVEDSGQNSIVVVSGANRTLTPDDVSSKESLIETADVLLVQLEIPVESVLRGIEIARASGVRIILDPAPAPVDAPKDMMNVDLICPNESEATALTGIGVASENDAKQAAAQLHHMGAQNVAITLGEKGTLLFDGNESFMFPSFAVSAIDTTAAGDAFAGALAVRWAQTGDLKQALVFANAAGAIAASKPGAQVSMGTKQEIESLMRNN